MYWAGTGRAEVGATVMARSSFDAAPWTSLRASQRPIWFNRMCHLEDWSGYVLALMWPQAEPPPHLGVVPHRPAKAAAAHLPAPPSSINLPTSQTDTSADTYETTSFVFLIRDRRDNSSHKGAEQPRQPVTLDMRPPFQHQLWVTGP